MTSISPRNGASTGTPASVLIIDDHEIFAQSLARVIQSEPGMTVVGSAGTVAEGLRLIEQLHPHVVLMDVELPDGDGIEATRHIMANSMQTRVVLLTGRADEEARRRGLEAGCAGFVVKSDSLDRLVGAVRAAAPAKTSVRRASTLLTDTLTLREREVLGLVASGLANKAIARQLDLSLNTVRNHVQRALHKLDARTRLQAVAIAVAEGAISQGR